MSSRLTRDVELICLCDGEWFICDGRIAAVDPRRLVSYVERVDDGFDVLWLPTPSVEHVPSLEDAVDAARRYCSQH
jgi:hypothetical protein